MYTNEKAYIVALDRDKISLHNKNSISLLETENIYAYPKGGHFLSYVPHYFAFHYDGYLQRVSKVERYETIEKWGMTLFVCYLGENIINRSIKSGRIWNNRMWVYIKLLLDDPKTLYDAAMETKRIDERNMPLNKEVLILNKPFCGEWLKSHEIGHET